MPLSMYVTMLHLNLSYTQGAKLSLKHATRGAVNTGSGLRYERIVLELL